MVFWKNICLVKQFAWVYLYNIMENPEQIFGQPNSLAALNKHADVVQYKSFTTGH